MPPVRKSLRPNDKRDNSTDLSKGGPEGHRQLRLFAKKGVLLNFRVDYVTRLP
jgi:hypothetical protein